MEISSQVHLAPITHPVRGAYTSMEEVGTPRISLTPVRPGPPHSDTRLGRNPPAPHSVGKSSGDPVQDFTDLISSFGDSKASGNNSE